jgi:hypothetical protein
MNVELILCSSQQGERTTSRVHDPLKPCEGSREPCPFSVSRETEMRARLVRYGSLGPRRPFGGPLRINSISDELFSLFIV